MMLLNECIIHWAQCIIKDRTNILRSPNPRALIGIDYVLSREYNITGINLNAHVCASVNACVSTWIHACIDVYVCVFVRA